MFTKAHYEFIAKVVREQLDESEGDEVDGVIDLTNRLAASFAKDNPRFDSEKFIHAALAV